MQNGTADGHYKSNKDYRSNHRQASIHESTAEDKSATAVAVTSSPLCTLPQDVLLIISSTLDPIHLSRLSQVCSHLYQFIKLAYDQWLLPRPRVRILPLSREKEKLQLQLLDDNDNAQSKPPPGSNSASVSNLEIRQKDRSGKGKVQKVEKEKLIAPSEDQRNLGALRLHPSYAAYLAAQTFLVDQAWEIRPSLKATVLRLPSSSSSKDQAASYKLYSRESLSLPILKLNPKGLFLITRNQIRFWSSENLRKRGDAKEKEGSIGNFPPELFTLREPDESNQKQVKSTAWDDVSSCQLLESKGEEIELVIGRVNGNLESWILFPSSCSSLSDLQSNVKLIFSHKPSPRPRSVDLNSRPPESASNGSQTSGRDAIGRKEKEIGTEALDGTQIQSISLDRDGLLCVATKKGRISIWKVWQGSNSKGSIIGKQSSKPHRSTQTAVPGSATHARSLQTRSDIFVSKNAKRRAKARASKQEARSAETAQEKMQLLSVWNIPPPTPRGTNGSVRVWSLLLGGDSEGNKWVSIGVTGMNPIVIYPIDPLTFKPSEPFLLSASGRPTSVYSLASTSMYGSSETGAGGKNSIIPSHLLFAGCYDGSVRAYDLREVSKRLEERKGSGYHSNTESELKLDLESKDISLSEATSELSLVKTASPETLSDPIHPIRTFKDRFDDSAVYELALGGGGGNRIMAGTARNGVVRFFKWQEGEEGGCEREAVGNENGFSLFAAYPSTSSSPTYSLVADYDRIFGATDSKLWELDFRPQVRLPGEKFQVAVQKSNGSVQDANVGSRAYYRHGEMALENTRKRIGER